MKNELTLDSLCGKHIFSGVEIKEITFKDEYGYEEQCTACMFELDGFSYMVVEDPSDGYRSYCRDLKVIEDKPKFTFPGIEVLCSMMENTKYEKNNVLVLRDIKNGKTILEVGTENYDDYYPMAVFRYSPENMSCNQKTTPDR